MTAGLTDVRDLAITAESGAAVARFDALMDDLYYYRVGVVDRLDALLQEFPEFVLAHVLKGYSLMAEGTLDVQPKVKSPETAMMGPNCRQLRGSRTVPSPRVV